MLKILKDFFGKNSKSQNKSISLTEDLKHNTITFSIDRWDRVTINVTFENEDMPCSETFGKLLYSINHGIYEDKMLECLVALSKNNSSLIPSIQKVLNTWGIMIVSKDPGPSKDNLDTSKKTDNPFIKPTSVFINK